MCDIANQNRSRFGTGIFCNRLSRNTKFERDNRIFVAYKNISAARTLGRIGGSNLKASKNNYVAAKFMR